jgi:putative resolvase
VQTLRRWMKAGKLVGTQSGREVRIPRTEIERLLGMHPGRMVVLDQQVSEVVVTYADRLTRFGFAYFQWWFAEYATRVVALDEDETKAPEQELVDDLIAIITSFSGRLSGMRSHKQQALLACAKQVITGTEE